MNGLCRDVSRIWFENHCLKNATLSKPYSDASLLYNGISSFFIVYVIGLACPCFFL